jgi:hypothetical protein
MKTISNLDELVEYIKSTDGNLFVRYCAHPKSDIKRGYSTDYVTGRTHEGLSSEALVDIRNGIFERGSRRYVAMQVASYSYMRYQGIKGTKGYIFAGECVGEDSDNAYLIANAKVIAVLSDECVEQAISEYNNR